MSLSSSEIEYAVLRLGFNGVIEGDELAPNNCPEDLNGDGVISVADVLLVLGEFGCSSTCVYDVDGDGFITVGDVLAILSVFGSACG